MVALLCKRNILKANIGCSGGVTLAWKAVEIPIGEILRWTVANQYELENQLSGSEKSDFDKYLDHLKLNIKNAVCDSFDQAAMAEAIVRLL